MEVHKLETQPGCSAVQFPPVCDRFGQFAINFRIPQIFPPRDYRIAQVLPQHGQKFTSNALLFPFENSGDGEAEVIVSSSGEPGYLLEVRGPDRRNRFRRQDETFREQCLQLLFARPEVDRYIRGPGAFLAVKRMF
jgi:hypothetical protein